MTTMTSILMPDTVADRPITEDPVTSGGIAEGPESGDPNFHVGMRGRMMLAFVGLMVPAAAALYVYGQLSPGV
ncbi:MAG: hypothetical protein QG597_3959 [Actinomycetota bacterium]|jgi:hypothetical protein|nr:hypothetical protein [Actinomycetota bacterium]